MHIRSVARKIVDTLVKPLGIRVVNRDWGPRGFAPAFWDIKKRGFLPKTILDVGASTGIWTEECCLIFPDADYFLIDPLPENAATLQKLSQEHKNIDYWGGALGAKKGHLDLNHHGDQSSFLDSEEFSGKPLSVEIRTIDSLLEEHHFKTPLLIKADVQGYELEVLKGASEALQYCEVLLLELFIQPSYKESILAHDVIAYLGERGFCIYDMASYVERPRDQALAYIDFIFVREDSKLMADIGWN